MEFRKSLEKSTKTYLEAEDLRLDKLERSSVDLDETTAGL